MFSITATDHSLHCNSVRLVREPESAQGAHSFQGMKEILHSEYVINLLTVKSKGFPYSLPSVRPGADLNVQAVSPHVTILSHPPGGRLILLSARPAVTFPTAERHRLLAGTKLHCLVAEAHSANNLPKLVTQLSYTIYECIYEYMQCCVEMDRKLSY